MDDESENIYPANPPYTPAGLPRRVLCFFGYHDQYSFANMRFCTRCPWFETTPSFLMNLTGHGCPRCQRCNKYYGPNVNMLPHMFPPVCQCPAPLVGVPDVIKELHKNPLHL